jgi:hypothetical protein
MAAVFIAATSSELRRLALLRGAEIAATFHAQSGAMIGELISGGGSEVDIEPHLNAMLSGSTYVSVHTHRASTSFSDADALVLAVNRLVTCVVAIGTDGTWYLLSKVPDLAHPEPADVVREFTAAAVALSQRHLQMVRLGRRSPEEALREFSHEVWLLTAPRLGLLYDRISED